MRPIKFRAWDVDHKVFAQFDLTDLDSMNLVFGRNGLAENDGQEYTQYTGLLDKNGVEIYEGDVTHVKGAQVIFRVEFVNGSFCLVPTHTHSYDVVDRWTDGKATKIMPLHLVVKGTGNLGDLEVIGNIWENPDLIGGKKDE